MAGKESQIEEYIEANEYQKAIDLYESFTPEQKKQNLTLIAIAEAGLEHWQEAYKYMEAAYNARQEPNSAFMLGSIAENFDKKLAIKWYKKSIEKGEKAKEARLRIKEMEGAQQPENPEEANYILTFFDSEFTFKDIIGMKKLKESLYDQIINAIKYPEIYKKYKKKPSAAYLFYGAPGCGKTFLAKCLCGESQKALSGNSKKKVKMAVVRTSKILDMYVGNSEKNISKLFDQARQNAPCILFFDEFDALGRTRSSNNDMASDSSTMSKVVDELLTEMDGVEKKNDQIFLVAATNRPWEIDESLKRSGRFSNSSEYISPPTYQERKELFRHYLEGKPIRKISWDRLARATMGYSQADIAHICDIASLPSIKKEIKHIEKKEENDQDTYYITTATVLSQVKQVKSSIESWYISMKKELVGTPKVEIVNGKKYTNFVQGKMDTQEKRQYKALMEDIRKYCSIDYQIGKGLMRNIALWIF